MIEVKNLSKTYRPKKGKEVRALDRINLQFEEKGLVFILGKSGSGKSTLLNMLGGLDQFDQGEIIIKGKSSKEFGQADFDSYRNTFIGFIFQEYNILNDFTVGANIALAMELQGKKVTKQTLNQILDEVDLTGFAHRKPNELSGGQKQRVAIARALIKSPEIIMADEPTGALDSNTGKQVFETLKRLSKDKLVIVVSHDREFAEQYGDRVIELRDGQVISDIKKFKAISENVSKGISIVDNRMIHIQAGYELTSNDLMMINEYLRKNTESDAFISLDGQMNNKIKKIANIDDNGNQDLFEETTSANLAIQSYDGSKLSLIKSKLPNRSSLKMAAGSLKKKPFRLVMTILLSMVAFFLFGLVNTMSSYDKIKTGTDSIIDSKVDYVSFAKKTKISYDDSYSYFSECKLTAEDISKIQKKYNSINWNPVLAVPGEDGQMEYSERLDFSSNLFDPTKLVSEAGYNFYSTGFAGLVHLEKEQIATMKYSLTGTLPAQEDEIVITKYEFETFMKAGYLVPNGDGKETKISKEEDMIGKKLLLTLDGTSEAKEYTVTGILDTKYDTSRYEVFRSSDLKQQDELGIFMIGREMKTVNNYSYHCMLYTSKALYDKVLNAKNGVSAYSNEYSIDLSDEDTYYSLKQIMEFSELTDEMRNRLVMFDENKVSLSENEIILSVSALMEKTDIYNKIVGNAELEQKKEAIYNQKSAIQVLAPKLCVSSNMNKWSGDEKAVKIVGLYVDEQMPFAIFNDGFVKANNIETGAKYSCVLGKMPESREKIQGIVQYSFDNGDPDTQYVLKNSTSDLFTNVNDLIEGGRKVFLYIGIGFAIFAGIMLMNFIATSISYRKREIGILRAVGARGRDVFVIFFQESLIIALINWILATGVTAVVVYIINTTIRTKYQFTVTILHFGIIQVVVMLGLSILVAFLASFLPIYKVSKKRPIEVIRKN